MRVGLYVFISFWFLLYRPFLVYVDTLFKENSTFKVSLKKENILKSKKEEHLVKPNQFLSYCLYVFGDVHYIILSIAFSFTLLPSNIFKHLIIQLQPTFASLKYLIVALPSGIK